MVPPLPKKRRVEQCSEATLRPPVVFEMPGLQPDTCLTVFDTEFHVHSTLLKLHSEFFRTFLDSPDKSIPIPGSGGFRYKWVTKVDEKDAELSWHLVEDKKKNEPFQHEKFTGNKETETMQFEKILCAIHLRPYSLDNLEELRYLVELADYYRSLPVVSFTIGKVVLDSKRLCDEIRSNPLDILEISQKLRNRELFQDAATWIAGCWDDPVLSQIEDTRIRSTVQHARLALAEAIISLDMKLILTLKAMDCTHLDDLGGRRLMDVIAMWDVIGGDDILDVWTYRPKMYREILEFIQDICCNELTPIEESLEEILENNLNYDRDHLRTGLDNLGEQFLCSCMVIPEDVLPWDTTETVW